jgi:beta-glucosidase
MLIGYRWYDYHSITPAFPFGHGLRYTCHALSPGFETLTRDVGRCSYTTFAYSNLQVSPTGVSVDIQNTGSRAGAEVAQLYLVRMPGKGCAQQAQIKAGGALGLPIGLRRTAQAAEGLQQADAGPGPEVHRDLSSG